MKRLVIILLVIVAASASFSQTRDTVTVFGPEKFMRAEGRPAVVDTTFSIPKGAISPFVLHVSTGSYRDRNHRGDDRSGGRDNSRRNDERDFRNEDVNITATVWIDGRVVLSPRDFMRHRREIERRLWLRPTNLLKVRVEGDPDTYIVLQITGAGTVDNIPPELTLTSPASGTITRDSAVTVSGTVTDQSALTLQVNGVTIPVTDSSFSVPVSLSEGTNVITVVATDVYNNISTKTLTVIKDSTPPILTLESPSNGLITKDTVVTAWGTVADSTAVKVTVNGTNVVVDADTFRTTLGLVEGVNTVSVMATDAAGNTTTLVGIVRLYTTPPAVTVQSPPDGATTSDSTIMVKGNVQDSTGSIVTVNGDTASVDSNGSFSITIPLANGANQIVVSVTDAAGNSSSKDISVTRSTIILPPDPSTVASRIDPTVVTTVGVATKFLYTGPNPIQTGVDTLMMSAVRAAVIRGRVLQQNGQPLSGVTVSILNHPEFGETISRADGMYDMAVNGGGQLTVNFARSGYLTAQRQENTPWQSYAYIDSVVLVQFDPKVTVVRLGGDSISVARGSVVTDRDGTRQATLLFKPGTQATMKIVHFTYQPVTSCNLARLVKVPTDTETVPLDSISVRATEYTVGQNGEQAMPAALPPSSFYTYCVDFSSDEAVAAGATSVTFSEPVPFYLQNFLKFPVGTVIPAGYYDKDKGSWMALANGLVIGIIDTANGVAAIDLNGDGTPADSAALAALGIDRLEQERLATLYGSGQNLWRVQVTHFTPEDYNWAGIIDGDGTPDDQVITTPDQTTSTDPNCQTGSIIDVQDQTLGESLNITGTPYTMCYSTQRFKKQALLLPLTGETLPNGLTGVELDIQIGGRDMDTMYTPRPGLTKYFAWDGKDAYGRALQGQQNVQVHIGYQYNATYLGQPQHEAHPRWGVYGDSSMSLTDGRGHAMAWRNVSTTLGANDSSISTDLGGWNLNVHHVYDPNGKRIYFGYGGEEEASSIGPEVNDVQGTLGDGDSWIAVAPDGVIYFSRSNDNQVWKKCTDGSIVLVAGTGAMGHSGDGGPAARATLNGSDGLAFGPDGSLYIADTWNACIRRVDPFGVITTYAGTGTQGFSGDGGPAVKAELNFPVGIAIGSDGTLYIADAGANVVRAVNPAGIINTVAGNGTAGLSGDGGSSLNAELNFPTGVDVDDQGNVFIADYSNWRVRKITPEGIISTVAGTVNHWTGAENGDGGPATEALLVYPLSVTVGSDGAVYIDESRDIRRVSPDGSISTFLTQTQSYGGSINASAIGPNGAFFCSESAPCIAYSYLRKEPLEVASVAPWTVNCSGLSIIHELTLPYPGLSGSGISIASEDGSEVYVFDQYGRHLKTLDALTGIPIYTFTYDSLGLLSSVFDRNGLSTTIQRNASGTPLAIVSPYGQRTVLGIDTAGCLTTVIDPGSDSSSFTYNSGLMASFRDARGNTHTFGYDSYGRLTYDQEPGGAYKILTRADSSDGTGYSVTVSTALGNKTVYGVCSLPNGSQLMTTTDASGLTDSTTYDYHGTWTKVSHDGTVTVTRQGPDPRFGMQSPVNANVTVTTPSGMQSITEESRTVSEMAGLQIQQFIDSVSVNGRLYQTVYSDIGASGSAVDGARHLFSAMSPQGRQSFTYIDSLARVVEDSIPGLVPVKCFYDGRGRLASVAQGARISYFTYDSLGRIDLSKDPAGNTSGFTYDSVGRVAVQTLPDGHVIAFAYDANGNMITLTPPGRPSHTFGFNADNLTDRYTPPFAGDSLRATSYSYDLDNRLARTALPDGRAVTITYDTAGCGCGGTADRIRSITFDRGTQTFTYDSAGNLSLSITPEHDSLIYVYDGFIPWATIFSGTVKGVVVYDIDGNYELDDIALIEGNQWYPHNSIGYDYDEDGLLTGIYQPIDSNWDEDQNHYMTIDRDFQTGKVTGTSLGNVSSEDAYDDYGILSNYEADYNDSPMFEMTYGRDSLGRITSMYETEFGVSKEMDYSYDSVGRLTDVWRNDTLISRYIYDANGNRIAHITPAGTDSGTYDAQDRMLTYGGAQYFYTANGDLREKIAGTDTTEYTYDALGNLMQVVMPNGDVIQYVVDGQNRRIAEKRNGGIVEKWIYAGQLTPIAELDSSNNIIARFSGGYMDKNDTIYQIITDHLGSVKLVVDVETGAIAQRMDYDEFGNVIFDSNPGFQPFGFAGGLYDPETKLVRFGARDYDASTGRWTNRDPILFEGNVSNLYGYCVEDPINDVDISGLKTYIVVVAGASGAIGPVGVESGTVILVDPSTWAAFEYPYFGVTGGAGTVAAAAGEIQVGAWDVSTPTQTLGLGWEVSGFAAAGPGISGGIQGNFWNIFGATGGGAAGGGATIGAGLSWTSYGGMVKFSDLSKDVQDAIMKFLGKTKSPCP